MVTRFGRRLLVACCALLGALVCAAFFWIGSDHAVLHGPLISWAVAGGLAGGLTARALMLD
jgi:hypothetical protein